MNCCNEYGQCKQGHGCPVRSTPLPPAQLPVQFADEDFAYTVRDALHDLGATLAICAIVAVVAFNIGYWVR